jgi:crossover junction endodeoxyribonuclease RusA
MTVTVTYELPYPPSLNHYWRHVGAKVLISAAGRAYRESVAVALISQKARAVPPCRLCVELDVHPPDRRVRDLDNLLKGLLDAITHAGVWGDDSLIDRIVITRLGVEKPGRVLARLSPWEGEQ